MTGITEAGRSARKHLRKSALLNLPAFLSDPTDKYLLRLRFRPEYIIWRRKNADLELRTEKQNANTSCVTTQLNLGSVRISNSLWCDELERVPQLDIHGDQLHQVIRLTSA